MIKKITFVFALLFAFVVNAKCVVQQKTVKVNNTVQQQVVEVCDDNQKYEIGEVGFVGTLDMFREHPSQTGLFHHNGAICKWFIDRKFDVYVSNHEGIICNLSNNKWTIIDKF